MCRSSAIEHDSWASLYPGANATWSWDAIYPYMKSRYRFLSLKLRANVRLLESETFTAPSAANVKLADMTVDASLHGDSGPIHYSYPGFLCVFHPGFAARADRLALFLQSYPQSEP